MHLYLLQKLKIKPILMHLYLLQKLRIKPIQLIGGLLQIVVRMMVLFVLLLALMVGRIIPVAA
jgi:hypothetical protein